MRFKTGDGIIHINMVMGVRIVAKNGHIITDSVFTIITLIVVFFGKLVSVYVF